MVSVHVLFFSPFFRLKHLQKLRISLGPPLIEPHPKNLNQMNRTGTLAVEPTSVPERLALPKSIVPSLTSVGLRLGEVPVCFQTDGWTPRVRPFRVTIRWRLDGLVVFFWLLFFCFKKKHGGYTPKIAGFIYSLSF